MYSEDDYLLISGIQHFVFCRRQWALIHIENLWKENKDTVDGSYFHRIVDDYERYEKRSDRIIISGLRVASSNHGINGICDIVEFKKSEDGIALTGKEGLWTPYPIEYKKGTEKADHEDILQLCAQAMCLEEMLCCYIAEGALYYGKTRKRTNIIFSDELRQEVISIIEEMRMYMSKGHTPKPPKKRKCSNCSLKELCLPSLTNILSPSAYIDKMIGEIKCENC